MVTIRRMQKNDIETVYDMGMKVEGFAVSESTRFWTKEELYRWIDSKDDVLLVAEDEGKIIGYIMSRLHIPTRNAIIENVYVDERYRRKEIGSNLVRECLKQLKEKGTTYLYGLVKRDDKITIEFLKSLGFKRGYDFTWMELSL